MNKRKGFLAKAKSNITFSQPPLFWPGSGQLFSIANQLRYGLVLLTVFSLLLTGGILIYFSFQTQLQQLIFAQQERSHAAAGEINAYLDDLQRKLSYLARVPGLADLSPEIQHNLLEGLIRHNTAYQTVAILDHTGEIVTTASPEGVQLSLNSMAGTPLFLRTFKREEDFVGPVEADPNTGLPSVILASPIRDSQDKVAGVLLAQVNLNFLWFIVSQANVGETGYAYVIDNRNFLIAEKGSSPETFKLEDLSDRPFLRTLAAGATGDLATYTGLKEVEVLGVMAPIHNVHWEVIVELPTAEAYAPLRGMLMVMGVALTIAILLAVGLGVFLSRQIVIPLQRLTEASAQVSAGNMEAKVDITAHNEMGLLATTFNGMAAQIRHLVSGLQSHTHRLETIAILSERLTAILNLEQLLVEVVDQIKDSFGYYHVYIYLLDETPTLQRGGKGGVLVLAAETGEADPEMKTSNYTISMNDPMSLVARAARTGETVSLEDVHKAPDRPNSLLPETRSEMAVPITLEGEVVGVLGVQEGKIAGLDEGDANVLRSLANQVAVAIRNARLFAKVELALAEARAAQERYMEQSWDKAKITKRGGHYLYMQPNVTPPDQTELAKARQQALAQDRPVVVETNGGNIDQQVLVAPVTFRDKMIGALQLPTSHNGQAWSEDDLLVIQAVADQLAQTAENLRLFEETRERAGQERTIREITDKLRAASSLERLVKTAAEELGRRFSAELALVEFGVEQANEPIVGPVNGKSEPIKL